MGNWQPIPRRTFLRGMGTAVALPLLEGMLPAGTSRVIEAAESGNVGAPPLRMAFLYIPNGAHMPDWTPADAGTGYQLPPILQPLEPVKQDVLVLTGLAHDKANANGDGAGDHARSAATFLTGAQAVKTDGKDIRVGTSVDQIAAKHLGKETRLRSLELGCEQGSSTGNCDSGYSCAYSTNISWRSPTTPAIKEVNPRLVFDRLFGNGDQQEESRSRAKRDRDRASVLDFVGDQAKRFRLRLGSADRQKLDEYLDSIREIERQIETPPGELLADGQLRPPEGIPGEYAAHVRLMGDLMTLAFQTDTTRVCTFMFANAGSDRTYPSINVREGHHTISHHQDDPELQAKIAKINRFHVEQLAYILQRLKSTSEGDGTLLDNTTLVYGSGIGDGNRHNHDDLPILVAGRGRGTIDPGRHVVLPQSTPLMNLYLTMLQGAGMSVEQLGDSTGALTGLRAG